MFLTIHRTDGKPADVIEAVPNLTDGQPGHPTKTGAVLRQYGLSFDARGVDDEGLPSGGYVYRIAFDDLAGIAVSKDKPEPADDEAAVEEPAAVA